MNCRVLTDILGYFNMFIHLLSTLIEESASGVFTFVFHEQKWKDHLAGYEKEGPYNYRLTSTPLY